MNAMQTTVEEFDVVLARDCGISIGPRRDSTVTMDNGDVVDTGTGEYVCRSV